MRSPVLAPLAAARFSMRSYLLGFIAALVLPLLAFSFFVLNRYAEAERARFEREAAQIANHVSLVVDGELTGLAALLKGLAASAALARGDLAEFHAEAKRVVQGQDLLIVLRDLGDRQLLNTQREFGTQLPPAVPISEPEQKTFAAGQV